MDCLSLTHLSSAELMQLLELQTIGLGETPFLCFQRGQATVLDVSGLP